MEFLRDEYIRKEYMRTQYKPLYGESGQWHKHLQELVESFLLRINSHLPEVMITKVSFR